jgi:ubiquinone/menaquinone biosynthesis C-methylase UbiE
MKQAQTFLDGEADAWIERNREKMGRHDPVSEIIADIGLQPTRILEIGCADGWRVERLKERFPTCSVRGIDPARIGGRSTSVIRGTADDLGAFPPAEFDLVIYGFCLYLCDRRDLFKIAAEGDRVLQDRGQIIVHDFAVPEEPFARIYEHRLGILSYHMDYTKLWLAHPWYRQVAGRTFDRDESVIVLQKDCAASFPVRT